MHMPAWSTGKLNSLELFTVSSPEQSRWISQIMGSGNASLQLQVSAPPSLVNSKERGASRGPEEMDVVKIND